jgi:hypothetical protein
MATVTLVIVPFKICVANKREQLKVEVEVVDVAALSSPTYIPPCGSPSCINAFSNGPLVVCCRLFDDLTNADVDVTQISESSCSDQQSTWEDSQNKGKSMITVRTPLFLLLYRPRDH